MNNEDLPKKCHEAWSGWIKYMFEKGNVIEGELRIPPSLTASWLRQANTDYHDLSEDEKESHKEEAERFMSSPNFDEISEYVNKNI